MPNFARWVYPVFFFACLVLVRAAEPFPQEGSDLKPDPAARFGSLPNGLRYIIYPNQEPRDRASLRLAVLTGSLEESDQQRGLAHFLEHMAFNGSAHYPPGTLVEFFQRMGMNFGGDTNAYTSFDHTAYQIELPDTKPGTLAEGLQVFADMAGTLLLRPDMIEKERPIILAEKRTRDSVEYRQFLASFDFLLADSLLPKRMPIGVQEVIEHADRSRFVDLYNTWYRPERMAVIVVGDIDPAKIEAQIVAAFSSIVDRSPPRPDPSLGQATSALGLRTAFHSEPEAPSTTVSIDVIAPYRPLADTAAVRLQHLRRDLAVAMFNRRLSILAKQEGAPFIRANVSVDESFRFVHDAGINITCNAGQWQSALGLGEQELRRVLQFGFSAAELKEAAANFRNDLKQAASSAATRRSQDLANALVGSLVSRTVVTSPQQDLELFGPALDAITPEDCTQSLRLAFATPGRYVLVSGNARVPGDPSAAIAAAYNRAHAVALKAPDNASSSEFAYTHFGPAGQIRSRRHVDDLDLTLVEFANGVRVNLKKTPFEANQIRISVRVGGGRLTEDRSKPGLAVFSDITFSAGGLGKHSSDDLQRLLAGRTVGLEFSSRSDAFALTGATNPADLLLELQLMTAYLTDPGYRPEAMRVAKKEIDEFYSEMAHSIEGPLQTEVPRLLANGDVRFGLPPVEDTRSRSLAEEKAWLAPAWAHGAIEIGIVGDLDVETALGAIAQTFGALPQRDAKPAYSEARIVHFPATPFLKNYEIPSKIPKAAVALYWPTTDSWDIGRTRRLGILSEILSDRLRVKVREELGGAYSPEAASEPSDTYRDYGFLVTEVVVAPERAEELRKSVLELVADMAKNGVTQDQLDRAKKPALTGLRESARTNQYWLNAVLGSCQEFPQRLDWARTRYSDIGAISKAEIDALARTYLGPAKAFQVVVRPVN